MTKNTAFLVLAAGIDHAQAHVELAQHALAAPVGPAGLDDLLEVLDGGIELGGEVVVLHRRVVQLLRGLILGRCVHLR